MPRTPETVAAEIRAWDKRDVHELRELLAELFAMRNDNGEEIDAREYVDVTNLPSAPIPDWIDTGYPIWAVDSAGFALTGNLDAIERLDYIAQWQLNGDC